MTVWLSASALAASPAKAYPAELAGTWMIQSDTQEGALPCKASDPLVQESEATMSISGSDLRQYESSSTPRSIRRIAKRPAVWEIQETEEEADNLRRPTRVYVLQSDRLTVFEDEFTLVYKRCL